MAKFFLSVMNIIHSCIFSCLFLLPLMRLISSLVSRVVSRPVSRQISRQASRQVSRQVVAASIFGQQINTSYCFFSLFFYSDHTKIKIEGQVVRDLFRWTDRCHVTGCAKKSQKRLY